MDRPQVVWDYVHGQKLAAYFGTRESDIPCTRGRKLSDAIQGDFSRLDPSEITHLTTDDAKRNWACDELDAHIRAEVHHLETHRASLDLSGIARDRAETGDRALFDPGKEATQARKYEAASTRELYRSLREFHTVEAAANAADNLADGFTDPEITTSVGPLDRSAPASLPEPVAAAEPGDTSEPKALDTNSLGAALGSFGRESRKLVDDASGRLDTSGCHEIGTPTPCAPSLPEPHGVEYHPVAPGKLSGQKET